MHNHIHLYIKQEYNVFDLTYICIYTHMRTLHVNIYFTFYVTSPRATQGKRGLFHLTIYSVSQADSTVMGKSRQQALKVAGHTAYAVREKREVASQWSATFPPFHTVQDTSPSN